MLFFNCLLLFLSYLLLFLSCGSSLSTVFYFSIVKYSTSNATEILYVKNNICTLYIQWMRLIYKWYIVFSLLYDYWLNEYGIYPTLNILTDQQIHILLCKRYYVCVQLVFSCKNIKKRWSKNMKLIQKECKQMLLGQDNTKKGKYMYKYKN